MNVAVSTIRSAPSTLHVIRAIATREFLLGSKRKLVRLLFLASLIPPLVLTIILVVRIMAKQATGFDLGWDPLLAFLSFQALPVALLALGLGTPSVARDRAEDVLFLYATRPVSPWHYAWGKQLAVMVPAAGLLLVPGVLIAIFRLSVTQELDLTGALSMSLKVAFASVLLGWAYAGIAVGPSAATKRARWALLLALLVFVIPSAVEGILWRGDTAYPLAPGSAITSLLSLLFEAKPHGWWGIPVLLIYGVLGLSITSARVRQEMIP